MQEIKFKAKRLDNREWVEGDRLKFGDRWFIVPDSLSLSTLKNKVNGNEYALQLFLNQIHEVDPETVCQFTGRNNLWGWDRINVIDTIIGTIVWDDKLLRWAVKEDETDDYYPLADFDEADIKRIGSIHDKPEEEKE